MNEQIKEWLQEGIVRPSNLDDINPVVIVKKKDGTSRLCVDYRNLNKKIIKDHYPIPLIEDVLEWVKDHEVFTTLDLKNGFFHVDIHEESVRYTSFVVPDGQYEFTKVPFGLSNSPSVFTRYVNSIFHELKREGMLQTCMDDIIITAKNEQEN